MHLSKIIHVLFEIVCLFILVGYSQAANRLIVNDHPVKKHFSGAKSLYSADMDGDGDMDVIGAADTSNAITWWENTDGTGTAWTDHPVDEAFDGAYSVHTADIDGDGDMDVIGAANLADEISWWENTDRSGTAWAEHTVDANFDGAKSVYSADMDGDGDMDILGAASFAHDIYWWENTDGTGTAWIEYRIDSSFYGAWSILAADIDADGDMDVIGMGGDYISWWENTNVTGTAWTEHRIDSDFNTAKSVHAADIDGDGDMDVIGAAIDDDTIAWWENTDGTGTAWAKHIVDAAFNYPLSVHSADMDVDGDMDILGVAFLGDIISWWENTDGTGTAWTEHILDETFDGASAVHAADLDGDGDMDVLGAASPVGAITSWENTDGTGTAWAEHPVGADFYVAYSVHAADMDGDGDMDVVGAANYSDAVTLWENMDGTGTAWIERRVDGAFDGARSVRPADIDGDGDMDILGAAYSAGTIAWWENTDGTGTAWKKHTVDGDIDGAQSVHAADMDGDGDMDILGATENGSLSLWENTDGAGTAWTKLSLNFATSVRTADIDNDGDMDILCAINYSDRIIWRENTAGTVPTWKDHVVDDSIDDVISVDAADMDGDGDMDVLGAAYNADTVAWWENMDGTGAAWTKHTVDADFNGAHAVQAADMDGDGDMDVISAAYYADTIAWWENTDGDGTAWAEYTVDATFDGAQSVHAVDMDGDGDLDIIGAGGRAISWWGDGVTTAGKALPFIPLLLLSE